MKLTEEITATIEQYHNTTIEAHNLDFLMGMRKHLVVLAHKLGVETARAKRTLETKIAQRKIEFFRSKKDHLEEGVGKAETFAEVSISELREEEAVYQGLYDFGKIILNQTNEVLSSVQQDISTLKLEYKSL